MGVHDLEATNPRTRATEDAFKAKFIAIKGAPKCSAATSRHRHQKSNIAGTNSIRYLNVTRYQVTKRLG